MNKQCVFCTIAAGESDVSTVVQDPKIITLLDLGQFHNGHLLIAPRTHIKTFRDMDDAMVEAIILAVRRAVHVIDLEFPGDGVSVWQSTSNPSLPDLAHAHFHVHPTHALAQQPDRHALASGAPSPISSASVAKRLRRRVLETYSSTADRTITESSWEKIGDDVCVGRSHSSLWCGCSGRKAV